MYVETKKVEMYIYVCLICHIKSCVKSAITGTHLFLLDVGNTGPTPFFVRTGNFVFHHHFASDESFSIEILTKLKQFQHFNDFSYLYKIPLTKIFQARYMNEFTCTALTV